MQPRLDLLFVALVIEGEETVKGGAAGELAEGVALASPTDDSVRVRPRDDGGLVLGVNVTEFLFD